MFDATSPSQKATRFATVEDVSEQIFDSISPQDPSEGSNTIDRGRIRTRLLDFKFLRRVAHGEEHLTPSTERHCASCASQNNQSADVDGEQAVFGWLVIVEGPGRGRSIPLNKKITTVGRGNDQDVCLDFGDEYISRSEHVTIHFDRDRDLVAVRFEDKRNPVHLNGKVLSGIRLFQHKSRLTIGRTILRFVKIDDLEAFWSV